MTEGKTLDEGALWLRIADLLALMDGDPRLQRYTAALRGIEEVLVEGMVVEEEVGSEADPCLGAGVQPGGCGLPAGDRGGAGEGGSR